MSGPKQRRVTPPKSQIVASEFENDSFVLAEGGTIGAH